MAMDKNVFAELEKMGRRSRVFLSMPFVPGLTPIILNVPGRYTVHDGSEEIERRHGVFGMDEAALSPLDHGGLYGDAVFEGILIANRRVFVFKEHLSRWKTSAERMGITFPYGLTEMAEIIVNLVREVNFSADERGYLRPVLTRGFGNLGINPKKCIAPTVYVIASTIALYPPERYQTGIELSVARQIRRAGRTIQNPNVKSNNYLNNINGLIETAHQGTLETLMLTSDGFVAEATADNIFLVRAAEGWEGDPSKVVIETPSRGYCLVGITRNLVCQEAQALGYRVVERGDLLPMDLVGPQREVFMTGTGCGIMPIVAVEGVSVGTGTPGPITRGLLDRVTARMSDPAYALSLDATPKEIAAYMEAPLAVHP